MLPRSNASLEVYNLNDELTTVAVSVSDDGDPFKMTPNLKSQVFFILCESENFCPHGLLLFNYSQRGVTYDALMRQALSAFLSRHCTKLPERI